MTKNSGEPSDNMPDQFGDFEIAPENQLDDFFTDSQPTSQLAAITPDDSEDTTAIIAPSAAADVTEAFWGGGVAPDTVAVSSNLTDDLPDIVEEVPAYDYLGHVEYEPEYEEEDGSTNIVGGYFGNQQLLDDINIPQKSRFSSLAGSRRFWNAVAAAAVVAVAASAAWVLGFRDARPTESAEEATIDSSTVLQNDSVAPQELASPTTSTETLEKETPEEQQKAEEVLNVFPRMEQSVTAMKKENEKPTTTAEVPGTVADSTEKTTTTQRTSSFVTSTAPPVTSPSIVPPPQTATTLPTTAAPVTTSAPTTVQQTPAPTTPAPTTPAPTTPAPTTPAPTTAAPTTVAPPPPVTTVKPTTTPKPVTTVETTTTVEETTTTTDECEKDDDEDGTTTTTVAENNRGILGPIISISLPSPEPCDSDITGTTVDGQVTTTDTADIASTSNQ